MSMNRNMEPAAESRKGGLPVFVRKLSQASDALEMGFFFEEGGCWGMALALRDECAALGFPVRLCVREGDFVHAFVADDEEIAIDYRGVSPLADVPGWTVHTLDSFIAVAKQNGVSGDFLSDQTESARAVITAAKQLAARPSYTVEARRMVEQQGIKPAVDSVLARFLEHACESEKVSAVVQSSGRLCVEVVDRSREFPFSMRARVSLDPHSGAIQDFDGTPSMYCRRGWQSFDLTLAGCAPRLEPDCPIYGAPELRPGFH